MRALGRLPDFLSGSRTRVPEIDMFSFLLRATYGIKKLKDINIGDYYIHPPTTSVTLHLENHGAWRLIIFLSLFGVKPHSSPSILGHLYCGRWGGCGMEAQSQENKIY